MEPSIRSSNPLSNVAGLATCHWPICALFSHVIWIGATLCVAILSIVLMRGKWVPRLLDFASVVAPAHGSCSSLVTVWIFVGLAFDSAGEGTAKC